MTEQMSHITTDGAHIRALQFQPSQVSKFIKSNRAINRKLVFVDLAELLFLGIELVLNIAHDFLEHVFQRHHSNRAAIFVHHNGKMRVLCQKEVEELFERHHLGHWNELALDPEKIGLRVAHHRHQFFNVNQADRIIEMAAAEREPGVTRLQGLLYVFLKGLLDIEEDHVASWGHDIAHHPPAKIEGIDQQVSSE